MKSICRKLNVVQQKCFLHAINLAIVECFYKTNISLENNALEVEDTEDDYEISEIDIEDHGDIVLSDSLRDLISRVRDTNKRFRHGKKKDELQAIYSSKSTGELNLHLDVITRWNSMLPMIESFLKAWDALKAFYAENDLDFPFSLSNKKNLVDLEKLLSTIQTMILEISKDTANLMSADIAVTKCLQKIRKEDPRSLFANKIRTRYLERRTYLSDVLWNLANMSALNIDNEFYIETTDSQNILAYQLFRPFEETAEVDDIDPLIIAENPEKYQVGYFDKDFLINCLKNVRPSSICAERAFSVCSRILIHIRGKSSSEKLDTILFLNKNL